MFINNIFYGHLPFTEEVKEYLFFVFLVCPGIEIGNPQIRVQTAYPELISSHDYVSTSDQWGTRNFCIDSVFSIKSPNVHPFSNSLINCSLKQSAFISSFVEIHSLSPLFHCQGYPPLDVNGELGLEGLQQHQGS